MSDTERRSRIVDVAIRLSQGRGFENVGLREVAEEVGVALGTLYKTFKSKEEIISAAVEQQTRMLHRRFSRHPAQGATAVERLENFFSRLTRALSKNPAYARAVLVSIASNHADIMGSLLRHEDATKQIILAAMRGTTPGNVDLANVDPKEETIAFLLRQVWFAGMVGWGAGLYTPEQVVEHVVTSARILLEDRP
jgi:AcrR family transcriptional regulator